MRGIPHIRFNNEFGRFRVYCDGEVVGIFLPSLDQNRGEKFMQRMEQLRLLVADEVVDTFKYIDSLSHNQPIKR